MAGVQDSGAPRRITLAASRVDSAPGTSSYGRVARLLLSAILVASLVPLLLGTLTAVLGADVAGVPFYLVFLLLPANLGAVGALLATRRSENAIGWLLLLAGARLGGGLLLLAGALAGVAFACGEFQRFVLARGDPVSPLVVAAAWVASWAFIPAIGILIVFVPLLYPTGRLPGPRWRFVVAAGLFGVIASTIALATARGPPGDPRGPLNPFVPPEPLLTLIQTAGAIGNAIAAPVFLLSLVSVLIRFRRSRDVEREQIKWFLLAVAIAASVFAFSMLPLERISDAAWALGLLSMCFLPVAIGVAILRYRLYDIDRIVSRVVGYTLVTAVLGVSFAVVIVVAQAVLAPVTQSNTLAVAGSTLVVASLFQPVRHAIQTRVDRRFDRSHVRAEAVADSFSARLRDVTDLPTIRASIAEGVQTAWSPSSVGVWVRGSGARDGTTTRA